MSETFRYILPRIWLYLFHWTPMIGLCVIWMNCYKMHVDFYYFFIPPKLLKFANTDNMGKNKNRNRQIWRSVYSLNMNTLRHLTHSSTIPHWWFISHRLLSLNFVGRIRNLFLFVGLLLPEVKCERLAQQKVNKIIQSYIFGNVLFRLVGYRPTNTCAHKWEMIFYLSSFCFPCVHSLCLRLLSISNKHL